MFSTSSKLVASSSQRLRCITGRLPLVSSSIIHNSSITSLFNSGHPSLSHTCAAFSTHSHSNSIQPLVRSSVIREDAEAVIVDSPLGQRFAYPLPAFQSPTLSHHHSHSHDSSNSTCPSCLSTVSNQVKPNGVSGPVLSTANSVNGPVAPSSTRAVRFKDGSEAESGTYCELGQTQVLFGKNRLWQRTILSTQPTFFERLTNQQSPEFLWVGCSDSRVPANDIIGLLPGEVFVHRNVANVVVHTDFNFLSVLQYAVDVLKVKHVIVCGHYNCGGVRAAMGDKQYGLIDNWLRHIRDIYANNEDAFTPLESKDKKVDLLCEMNVRQQVANVCHTTVVQNAWERMQPVTVHGWIYGLHDGLLHDLGYSVSAANDINSVFSVREEKSSSPAKKSRKIVAEPLRHFGKGKVL